MDFWPSEGLVTGREDSGNEYWRERRPEGQEVQDTSESAENLTSVAQCHWGPTSPSNVYA
jgi:hypothetical protein